MIKKAPVVWPQWILQFYSVSNKMLETTNFVTLAHCCLSLMCRDILTVPVILNLCHTWTVKFLILKHHQIYVPKIVWNNQKRYANELHLIQLLHSSGYPQYSEILFQGSFLFKLQEGVSWYQIRWMKRVADHHVMVCQEMLQYHGRMSSSERMCERNIVQSSSFPTLYVELDK
jgi:hypothetical protein